MPLRLRVQADSAALGQAIGPTVAVALRVGRSQIQDTKYLVDTLRDVAREWVYSTMGNISQVKVLLA